VLLWVVLALLLVILVVGLVLVRRRRHREATPPAVPPAEEEIRVVDGIPQPAGTPGVDDGGDEGSSMDMMSGIMGRSPVADGPGEEIPTSPWTDRDLDYAKRPMPSTPPAAPGRALDASEWEEAEDDEDDAHVVTPPLPPPPPPAATARRPAAPAPPPPGVPSRRPPPRRPAVEEDEWEEVD
jgi:hypothetical protein